MLLPGPATLTLAGSLEEFTSEIVSTGVDLLITDDDDSQRLAALTVLAHQMPLPLLVRHITAADARMHGSHHLRERMDSDCHGDK